MVLLLAALSFFSVRNQSLPFVDACHYRALDGFVFCDVKYVLDVLLGNGLSRKTHLYDWAYRWRRVLIQNAMPPDMMVMGSKVFGELKEHVFESRAVVALFGVICMTGNAKPMLKATSMRHLESLVIFNLGTPAYSMEIAGETNLSVHPNGIVHGWDAFVQREHYATYAPIWGDMRANEVWGRRLSSSLDCAQFVDVLHFSLFAATVLQVGDPARASIATVLESLLAWLSLGFRAYLAGVHAGVSVAAEGLRSMPSQAPRALQVDPDNNMTRRRIDGNAAWQVLERAKIKGITPREYFEHNETDVSLTVCPSNAGIWEAIDCELFMNNSSDNFQGCKQLSVAFDPSTYSGEDTGGAVAYNLRTGMPTVAIKNDTALEGSMFRLPRRRRRCCCVDRRTEN